MEEFPWDGPLANLQFAFDTHIGHYVIGALAIVSLVCWVFSGENTNLRKLSAVAFGGGVALIALVLLAHLFPGPISPGAMPLVEDSTRQ